MNYTATLDGKVICGKPKPTPHEFGEVMVRSIANGEIKQVDCPLDHYFAEGLYGRRMYCERGTAVASQRHKKQHFTFVLKGSCKVFDGESVRRFTAPAVWITEPGTQRIIDCEADTEWMTVHSNPENITDLNILEPILADDTLADIKDIMLDCHKAEQIT